MKFRMIPAVLTVLLPFGIAGAEEAAGKVPTLRPTHQQLSKERDAARRSGPVGLEQVESAEVEQKRGDQTSLVRRSTVIGFGDYWTLVPKGAVLHVPAKLRARVGVEPSGRLLSWAAFYERNRGWLRQQPVEVSHARGEESLDEAVVKSYTNFSQVVVATCHNGPISMKKPAAPVAPATAQQTSR